MFFIFLLSFLVQIQSEAKLAFPANSSLYNLQDFVKEENVLNINDISAEVVLVKEFNGRELFQKNIDELKDIASITKLMSSYLGYFLFAENNLFVFDGESIKQEGEVGNFYIGETISRNDILKAALVASSNDAIYLLAKTYDLEKFVDLMNKKAREFGLLKTRFTDPTGLKENLSTARDIFKLIEKIYSQAPEIFSWTLLERININGKFLWTTNILLPKYRSIIVGGKTGYKETAGENFVMILKFKRSPFIGLVILNSKNRFADSEKIIKELIKYYDN